MDGCAPSPPRPSPRCWGSVYCRWWDIWVTVDAENSTYSRSPGNRGPFTPPAQLSIMAAPHPPSPTLTDILLAPVPAPAPPPAPPSPSPSIVEVDSPVFPDSPQLFPANGPPLFAPPPIFPLAPPVIRLPESRGRSRSRSPRPPYFACGNRPHMLPTLSDYSPTRSYSPSFTPPPSRRRRCYRRPSRSRSRTPSPIRRPYTYPSPQVIITQAPPPPPVEVHMPSMSPPTPIPMWPPPVPAPEPVEVLTFHYGTNMAYAPAVKTYDVSLFSIPARHEQHVQFESSDPPVCFLLVITGGHK